MRLFEQKSARLFLFCMGVKLLIAWPAVTALAPSAHAQGYLRGGNVHAIVFNEDERNYVERLQSKGANAVRLFLPNDAAETQNEAEYRQWFYETALPRLDEMVRLFVESYGMKALISIHSAPGGRILDGSFPVDNILIPEPEFEWMRNVLVECWSEIGRRYNRYGGAVMYQLFNEPAPPRWDGTAWYSLQERLIKAIRTADTTPIGQQPVIYYMTLYGNPSSPKQINLSAAQGRMGIAANMYYPFFYTHQLTASAINKKAYSYPGCAIAGAPKPRRASASDLKRRKSCSRHGLIGSLKKFASFAKAHGLPAIMPEIAVSRRAIGGDLYLKDALFALKGINAGWFYLTLTERGNAPFNLRCADSSGESCKLLPLAKPSRRQRVLEKYFGEVKKSLSNFTQEPQRH